MTSNLLPYLRQISPFHLLSDHDLLEIIDVSEQKIFFDQQVVVSQNDQEVKHIYLILDGIARNIIINDAYEEITIKTYGKGNIFGLMHAISKEGFTYTIRAVQDVTILLIPITHFDKLMNKYPTLTEEVARLISIRLRELYQQIGRETSLPKHQNNNQHRKKMVELMNYPVITSPTEQNVVDISQTMVKHHISSVLVVNDKQDLIGIITERDVIRTIASNCKVKINNSMRLPTAEKIMSSPLITLNSQAFYFEAFYLMLKYQIKHLPIIENGKPIGIVTMKNLFDSIPHQTVSLLKNIEKAKDVKELSEIRNQLNEVIDKMLADNVSPKELCAIVSEFNDQTTQKIISIAEQELNDEGLGSPPVAYCWLSLGSEGRKEQTLQTDQDNAIIFADVSQKEYKKVDQYFKLLAEKVVDGLEQCGFPKCTGDVMATNPTWRKSVSEWKDTIKLLINKHTPEMIREFTILADMRAIYGDKGIAASVRHQFKSNLIPPHVLHLLAADEINVEVAISRFGRIQTGKGEQHGKIDIKHGGILHIINGLRMLSIKYGVDVNNSWERLEVLTNKGIISGDEMDEIQDAFDDLQLLRLEHSNNYLTLNSLSKKERIRLKKALLTTRWFQQYAVRHCALPGSPLKGI